MSGISANLKPVTDRLLGEGQTWQNMTASRFAGTNYTNNTGRPIFVSITFEQTSTFVVSMQFYVDGVEVSRGGQGSSPGGSPLAAIVPNGSTYSVTVAGNSASVWAELR